MDKIYNGIDVSRWQGTIDWPAVKASGVEFAFIRLGYCSYTGSVVKDTQFDANITGALAAGLEVGVYLYSYARDPEAATLAAQQTLALLGGYRLGYPVAFDLEDSTNVAKTKAENTAIAKAFLSAIAQAGYCPLLYTYKSFAETELNMDELADYDFWLAHITASTNYAGPYTVWQYSWTGSVNGISGDVDLDYCYKDYPAFMRENGLNGYGPEEGDGDGEPGDGGDGGTGGGTCPTEPPDLVYVVVKNDNLTLIAQRFGIPLRTLIQANPQIKNPNLIYVGDIIHIPQKPRSSN